MGCRISAQGPPLVFSVSLLQLLTTNRNYFKNVVCPRLPCLFILADSAPTGAACQTHDTRSNEHGQQD